MGRMVPLVRREIGGCMRSMKGFKDLRRILNDNHVLSVATGGEYNAHLVWGYGTNCGAVYRYEAKPTHHYNGRRVDWTIHSITPQQAYRIASELGLGRLENE